MLSGFTVIVRGYADALAGAVPAYGGEAKMDQLLLTVAECCRITAIGRTKFYELVANGEIPVRKLGKKTLVSTADLKQWAARLPMSEAKGADHEQPATAA